MNARLLSDEQRALAPAGALPRRARHASTRVLGHDGPFDAQEALEAGLVTFAPDDIDWEDELRLAIEERASFSPDALTGMEANLRFAGPETMETKIFGRLTAWQNWIFQRPNAVGERGALTLYGREGDRSSTGSGPDVRVRRCDSLRSGTETTIRHCSRQCRSTNEFPNNVNLSSDKRLQRALEHGSRSIIDWWSDMGPQGFQDQHQVYLRTGDQRRCGRAGRTSTT